MKKIKKIILTLLVMSFLANPMCLILRVHAANEEIAMSRISDTLQSVMQSSEEETIEVMIWLEDINTSQAVLSSTESILSAAKATLTPRALCENPETDAEIYTQYMDARKEAMRECYEEYTKNFSNKHFQSEEVCYYSRYAPMVIVQVSPDRISDIARKKGVLLVSDSEYAIDAESRESAPWDIIDDAELVVSDFDGNMLRSYYYGGDYYYTMQEINSYLGVNYLKDITHNLGQLKIGVIDNGYPMEYNSTNYTGKVFEHYPNYAGDFLSHADYVMDILYNILPEASYYYSNFEESFYNEDGIYSDIEWLMDNDVDVITCSVSIRRELASADNHTSYDSIARYIDYIIDNYLVTFVKSAGNKPEQGISSGGLAYNAITVGNYNLGESNIANSSAYYTENDYALKPDVCAPGYLQIFGIYDFGTSYSTPIVAAIAALVLAAENYIISPTPEEVKAIICASTDIHRYSILDSFGEVNENYRKYGTGIVDCWHIFSILQQNNVYHGEIATNANTISFSISMNNVIDYQFADLVFVYQKHSLSQEIDCNIANLNVYLYDFDGELIAWSTTNNNNIEVLRNIPTYDEDYTLVIQQVIPAISTGGTYPTSYAFAWNYKG